MELRKLKHELAGQLLKRLGALLVGVRCSLGRSAAVGEAFRARPRMPQNLTTQNALKRIEKEASATRSQ